MKKIGLLLFCLLLPICKINAFYCQYSDIAYLKKLASNITTSYTFKEENDAATFIITLTNLQPDLYIVDTINNTTYHYNGAELILDGYRSGQTIIYKVYTTKEFCEGELLATIRITLPTYNPYYKDNVCKGIDYELCNRWSSHGLDYNTFIKRVNQYKESLIVPPVPPKEEEIVEDTLFQKVLAIILDYYYIPLGLTIIGCGIAIYVINKKSDTYR